MADDLLVQPVKTTDFVNPQLDSTTTTPKQRQELNTSFKDFFAAEDAKSSADLSSEPTEPDDEPIVDDSPKPDTKAEPAKAEPPKVEPPPDIPEVKVEVSEPPKTPATSDIDAIEPHPAASDEHKSQFKQLKEATKSFRDTLKLYKDNLLPVLSEFGFDLTDSPAELAKTFNEFGSAVRALKEGGMTPEIQAELKSLRDLSRSVGVLQSEEFTRKYVKPIESSYLDVIREMAKHFNGTPEEIKSKFLEPMEKDYRPHQIPEQWWDTQLGLMKEGTSETVKQKIRQKIANVMLLQEQHDVAANDLATNKDSYAEWKRKSDEEAGRMYQALVMDEAVKTLNARPDLAEIVRPLATDGIKDQEKIKAILEHNKRAAALDQSFTTIIRDFGSGPRQAARVAIELIELREQNKIVADSIAKHKSDLESLKKSSDAELKAKEAEILALKSEVATRRKVADAPLKPNAGSGAKPAKEKPKLPLSSTKSLSEAFDSWKL